MGTPAAFWTAAADADAVHKGRGAVTLLRMAIDTLTLFYYAM
jgi:hypothetical protein